MFCVNRGLYDFNALLRTTPDNHVELSSVCPRCHPPSRVCGSVATVENVLMDFSTKWCLIHRIRRFASSWTASLPGQILEHVQPWGTLVFHEEKQTSTPFSSVQCWSIKKDQTGQITRALNTLGASMRRFALDEVQQCGNFWIFLATSRRKSGSVHVNLDLTRSRHLISTLNFQDAAIRYTCVVSCLGKSSQHLFEVSKIHVLGLENSTKRRTWKQQSNHHTVSIHLLLV